MSKRPLEALTETMFYVLMSFRKRDLCGAEIADFVERKTCGRVRLGPGTLYTILAKFEEEQLIREVNVLGRKRTYRLTDKGRACTATNWSGSGPVSPTRKARRRMRHEAGAQAGPRGLSGHARH